MEDLEAELSEAHNLKARVEELEDELDVASGELETARAEASKAGEDSARARADAASLKSAAVRSKPPPLLLYDCSLAPLSFHFCGAVPAPCPSPPSSAYFCPLGPLCQCRGSLERRAQPMQNEVHHTHVLMLFRPCSMKHGQSWPRWEVAWRFRSATWQSVTVSSSRHAKRYKPTPRKEMPYFFHSLCACERLPQFLLSDSGSRYSCVLTRGFAGFLGAGCEPQGSRRGEQWLHGGEGPVSRRGQAHFPGALALRGEEQVHGPTPFLGRTNST